MAKNCITRKRGNLELNQALQSFNFGELKSSVSHINYQYICSGLLLKFVFLFTGNTSHNHLELNNLINYNVISSHYNIFLQGQRGGKGPAGKDGPPVWLYIFNFLHFRHHDVGIHLFSITINFCLLTWLSVCRRELTCTCTVKSKTKVLQNRWCAWTSTSFILQLKPK